VSGAFLASDLCDTDHPLHEDRLFLENILKCKFRTGKASVSGNVKIVSSPFKPFKKGVLTYFDQLNPVSYAVEAPDAIEPADAFGSTICRYAEDNLSAAVAYSGSYKICAFGFPLETIKSEKERGNLIESVLSFFTSK